MKKSKIISEITAVILFMLCIAGPIAALAAGPAQVDLGTAGNFSILAKTGISTTGTTSVVGDIGVSPAAATYITGFSLNLPAGSAFASSSKVVGKVYAPGYANPTPSNMTTAISNMETAYTDGAGRTNPTATELGAGNIGGLTIAPGLYKWGTGVTIPTDVTLSGGANDVWIFVIAQNLNISSSKKIILSGGAQPKNIYWIVAGQTTVGTTAEFNGNILDKTAIVFNTGATLNGRAFAQAAVTLDANYVTIPEVSVSATPEVPTISPATPAMPANPASNNYGGSSYITPVFQNTNNMNTISPPAPVISGGQIKSVVTSYNFGNTTLKNGSKGEAVKELQRFLNKILNLGLVVDGKLGLKTIAVIKKWQKDNGLVADGLIGAKTKAKMNAQVK